MIDTIGLSILHGNYATLDKARFNPTFSKIDDTNPSEIYQFLKDKKGLQKYILNPKPEYRAQGIIYPNISIYETYNRSRGYQCNLKPHVSIPKMLFGHSIEEVNNKDYQLTVNTLQERLKAMGVFVYENAIHQASVTHVDYCMNILMQSEADARRFLHALSRMTLGNRYENHSRDYANNGKAVRFHTKTFEFIAYLKYYDFLGNGRNSVDKKTTLQEKCIAESLVKSNKIPPLVRLEARFNGKPAIRKHLRTILDIDKPTWTLREVFDEHNSRMVMQHYWHKLMDNPLNKIMLAEVSKNDLYHKAKQNFNEVPQRVIDNTIGTIERLQQQGTLHYKEELLKEYSRSKYYKDMKRIINFLEENDVKSNTDLFDFIESAIYKLPMQLGLPLY